MANRFLNDTSGGGDLTSLQNGSFDANLSTLTLQSALVNSVLITDNEKKVISVNQLPTDKIDYVFSDIVHNPNVGTLTSDDLKTDTLTAKTDFLTLQTPSGKALYKGSEVATMADVLSASGGGLLLYANYSVATTQPNLVSFPDGIISGTTTITPTPIGPTFVRAFEASSTTAPATSIDITISSVNTRECVAQWAFDTATYCVNGFITAGLWSFSIFGHAENNSLPHLNSQFSIYGHATGQPFTAVNMTLIANSSKEPFLTTSPNKSVIELSSVVPYTDTNNYDYIYIVLTCENGENSDHSATYFFESDQTYSHMHTTLPISGSVSPATITSLQDKTQNIDEGLTTSGLTTINGNITIPWNSGNSTIKTNSITTQNINPLNYDPAYPFANNTISINGNTIMDGRTLTMYGVGSYFATEGILSSSQSVNSNNFKNTASGNNINIEAVGADINLKSNVFITYPKLFTTPNMVTQNITGLNDPINYPGSNGNIGLIGGVTMFNNDFNMFGTCTFRCNTISANNSTPLLIKTYGDPQPIVLDAGLLAPVNSLSDIVVNTGKKLQTNEIVSTTLGGTISANSPVAFNNNISVSTINTRKPATGYFARINTLSSNGNQTNYDMIRPTLDITPLNSGAYILQADFYAGATWKLYASGTLSRNGATQTLLSFSVNLAGAASTLIHNFQAEATVAAGAARPWSLEYTITCNTGQSATAVFNTMAEWWHSPSATTNANIGEMAYQTAVTTTLENKFIELLMTSTGSLNQFNIHQMYLQRIY